MIGLLIAAALVGSELTFVLRALLWSDQKYQWFNGGSIYTLNILIVLVTGIPIYVSEEWKNTHMQLRDPTYITISNGRNS